MSSLFVRASLLSALPADIGLVASIEAKSVPGTRSPRVAPAPREPLSPNFLQKGSSFVQRAAGGLNFPIRLLSGATFTVAVGASPTVMDVMEACAKHLTADDHLKDIEKYDFKTVPTDAIQLRANDGRTLQKELALSHPLVALVGGEELVMNLLSTELDRKARMLEMIRGTPAYHLHIFLSMLNASDRKDEDIFLACVEVDHEAALRYMDPELKSNTEFLELAVPVMLRFTGIFPRRFWNAEKWNTESEAIFAMLQKADVNLNRLKFQEMVRSVEQSFEIFASWKRQVEESKWERRTEETKDQAQ